MYLTTICLLYKMKFANAQKATPLLSGVAFCFAVTLHFASPRRPVPTPNNFLSEQGLGGACELAAAKANLVFALTNCL